MSGISETAAAESSTSQESRVSKVRLSVATTDCGGTLTSFSPSLSVMVTVSPEAAELSPEPEPSSSELPQAARVRAAMVPRARPR